MGSAALTKLGQLARDGEGLPHFSPALNSLISPIPQGCLWFEQSEKPGSGKFSVSAQIRSFGLSPDSCEICQTWPQGHSSVYVCTRRGRQLHRGSAAQTLSRCFQSLLEWLLAIPCAGKAPAAP